MEKYFNDVFPWLLECEKIFGLDNLKGYDQTRLYAYLSERYLSFGLKNIQNILNGLGFLKILINFYKKCKKTH